MIAGAGARDIKQVPLAVVDFFEVGIIGNILDAPLRWDNLVIACHNRDDSEFQPLCEMHGSDRDLARRNLDLVAEFDRLDTGLFDGIPRPPKLAGGADEDSNLGG
jgi:hypothetical protein